MTPEENDLLCRVEGDAPMGQMMRRHWLPACMSEEVSEPDGAPVGVRLLGEDLVVFRDTAGRLGVLRNSCPHRGASLTLGRNEECGIRCLFHGWKFDVEGKVVDIPSEPPDSKMRHNPKVKAKAYRVQESGGIIWVYMGPDFGQVPFDPPPFAYTAKKIAIVKAVAECNWAQILEGSIDSSHSSNLHSASIPTGNMATANGLQPRPSVDRSPRLEVDLTDYGLRYAAIRIPIKNPDSENYVRITVYIAPFMVLVPPSELGYITSLVVPMDNEHTMFYEVAWAHDIDTDQDQYRKTNFAQLGVDIDGSFGKVRNIGNKYLQDRAAMKRGHFTGMEGILTEDMAMWESLGSVAERREEFLGSSDLAIVRFRRMMLKAVRDFQASGEAIGVDEPHISKRQISSYAGIISKTKDWRTFGGYLSAAE